MATFTVWKFDTPGGAEQAVTTLKALSTQDLITIEDAAIVSWPANKKSPKTEQLSSLTGLGALGGAFWGMLFGVLFFVPLLGIAFGAAAGALAGSLSNVGIDDDFIDSLRSRIQPGTSALFAMTSDTVIDKVQEAFSKHDAELIYSNLTADEEQKLREVFGTSSSGD